MKMQIGILFEDLNENGVWDEGESLQDDVGTDGLGPFDDDYSRTRFRWNCKETENRIKVNPNFGILDKDESDQLGLTGFAIYPCSYL
jgi:hypothetical protein